VRSPFNLGHRRAHALVAEAVDAGVNAPVGGRKHRPYWTAAPRRGRRGLGERDTGEGALGDRVDRGVIGRDVGAERLVKAVGREREFVAASGQLVLDDVRDDPRRGELGLQVGQVLALVRSETGDVDEDEADDVVGRPGRCDDRTSVGMTDQQDRPVDLVSPVRPR
jgi:hypothetical protein